MRVISAVLVAFFMITIPSIAVRSEASPDRAGEVEVLMDSTSMSCIPNPGTYSRAIEHGLVVWNTTLSPIGVMEIVVELQVMGSSYQCGISPQEFTLTRTANEQEVTLAMIVPPNCPPMTFGFTIEGYWYYRPYPGDMHTIDPVEMTLTIQPYSMVVYRDISDLGSEQVSKGTWNRLEMTFINNGNCDDTYMVTVSGPDSVRIRYDGSPISVPKSGSKELVLEIYPESSRTAEIVVSVVGDHPFQNCTGTLRFTLFVDSTDNVFNGRLMDDLLVGGAVLLLVVAFIVILALLRRRARSRRSPRGHG